MNNVNIKLWFLIACLFSCSQKPSKEKLFQESVSQLSLLPIKIDKNISSSIYAQKIISQKKLDQYYYFDFIAEKNKNIECFYYPKNLDPAGGHYSFLENLSEKISKSYKKPFIYEHHINAYEGNPYISVNYIYFTKTKPESFFNTKSLFLAGKNSSLICLSHFPITDKRLLYIIGPFFKNLKNKNLTENFDRDIYLLKSNKSTFGFVQRFKYSDKKDNKRFITLSSSIFPGSPHHFVARDILSIEDVDQFGNLLKGKFEMYRNRYKLYDLTLEIEGPEQYSLRGKHFNHDQFSTILSNSNLKHSYYVLDKDSEQRFDTFVPLYSPDSFFEIQKTNEHQYKSIIMDIDLDNNNILIKSFGNEVLHQKI